MPCHVCAVFINKKNYLKKKKKKVLSQSQKHERYNDIRQESSKKLTVEKLEPINVQL